jgi:hypothetical protein
MDDVSHRDPYPSSGSVLTLFVAEAAPVALAINNTRAGIPNIIIINSDVLRYNVFAGPFTRNDQLTAVPYTDSFSYIPNVMASVANQVLPFLNGGSVSKRSELEKELWGRGHVESRYRTWLQDMDKPQVGQTTLNTPDLTLGYVTTDVRRLFFFSSLRFVVVKLSFLFPQGCPGAGDDTLHVPLPYYSVPNYIGSNPPDVTSDTLIDLVFVSFIEKNMLSILNRVQSTTTYTSADVALYTPTLADAVLGLYAQAAWN